MARDGVVVALINGWENSTLFGLDVIDFLHSIGFEVGKTELSGMILALVQRGNPSGERYDIPA